MPANRSPEAWATHSAKNATKAPAAAGAMLYHSIPIQVSTWPTSFHQLYSMMKLAAVDAAQAMIPNKNIRTISFAICEGRIRGDFYSSSNGAASKPQKQILSDTALLQMQASRDRITMPTGARDRRGPERRQQCEGQPGVRGPKLPRLSSTAVRYHQEPIRRR